MSISSSISTYVNYVNVLHLMGRKVKPELPQTCSCPFCPQYMTISADIHGGAWFHCHNCGFAGDVFELCHKRLNSDNMRNTIKKMVKKYKLSLPADQLDHYINHTHPLRQMCTKFWHEAQSRVTRLDARAQVLLQQYDLYTGYPWRTRAPFGMATRHMVKELPNSPTIKGDVLVIPLQDMPGRYVGFQFIREGMDRTYLPDEDSLELNGDEYTGIAFLDDINLNSNAVYGLGDLMLALRLRLAHQLVTGSSTAPILGWTGSTPAIWESVRAKRLVLWGTSDVDTQAAKSTMIETDVSTIDLSDVTVDTEINTYLSVIQRINDTAEPRNVLKVPEEVPVVPTVEKVVERPDGWYAFLNGWKLISNVTLTPSYTLNMINEHDVRCHGTLTCGKTTVPFDAPVSKFQSAPHNSSVVKFVEAQFKNTTHDIKIRQRWISKLYDIGVNLRTTRYVDMYSGVNWDVFTSTWKIPNFKIHESGISEVDAPHDLEYVPGSAIKKIQTAERRVSCIPTLDNPSTFALFTLVLHNILAPIKNWAPWYIGICSDAAKASELYKWIMSGIGLCETYSKGSHNDNLTAPHVKATLPHVLWINPCATKALDRITMSNDAPANVLSVVSSKFLNVVELFPRWRFIPDIYGTAPDKYAWWLLPEVLQRLAKSNLELPEGTCTLDQVAKFVSDWCKYIPAGYQDILRTNVDTSQPGRDACMRMLHIASLHRAWTPSRVAIDKEHCIVTVDMASIHQTVSYHELVPTIRSIRRMLEAEDAVISWEEDHRKVTFKYDWWISNLKRLIQQLACQGQTGSAQLLAWASD